MPKHTLLKPQQPIRSKYYAKLRRLWGTRFAAPYIILAFVLITVGILFLLYPEKKLLLKVENVQIADQVAKEYLINMLKLYPDDDKFQLLLAEQEIAFGEIKKAEKSLEGFLKEKPTTEIDWKAMWLYYQILLGETYHHPANSSLRLLGMEKVKKFIAILANAPFTAPKLVKLAEDSLGLEDRKTAMKIFKRVLEMPAKRPPEAYAHAAKLTFAEGEYEMSAQYYFLAQQKSLDTNQKRIYFMDALKTLQSGNLLKEAMDEANKNIGELINDRETLIFLTKLALASNRPKKAEEYAKLAIQIQNRIVVK